MQIKRLVIQNFMSYAHADLALADRGLVLVEGENRDTGGSNGAGKSAIFEALHWGLFGKTLRDHPVSRNRAGECCVYLEVQCDDILLKLYRGSEHKDFGSKLHLYAGDTNVTLGTNKETQSRLEGYLQLDSDSFLSVVMFPQGASGFASLTDAGQKLILDSVLGTERFFAAQERVKADLTDLNQRIQRARYHISSTEKSLESIRQDIENLKAKEDIFVKEKDERCRRLEEQISSRALTEPKVDESLLTKQAELLADANPTALVGEKQILANTQARLVELRTKSAKLGERRAQLDLLLSDAPNEEPVKPDQHSSVYLGTCNQLNKQLAQLEVYIKQDEKTIADLTAKISNIPTQCEACGQKLPETAKAFLIGNKREQLKKAKESLALREASKKEWSSSLETASDFYHCALAWELWETAASQRQERLQIEGQVSAMAEQMVRLETLIEEQSTKIQTAIARVNQASELRLQYDRQKEYHAAWVEGSKALERALEDEKQRQSPYAEMQKDKEDLLQSQVKDLKLKMSATDLLSERKEMLDFWVVGFGNKGVKSLLLDSVVPMLNARASEYMEVLSGGAADVTFHTTTTLQSGETRDKFNVSVRYSGGADGYKGTSGGERRRVDISTLFALGDLASSRSLAPVELRLLDEPFENLDSLGNEQVVQLLKEKVLSRAKTILVMTHDEALKTLFDTRILVVKENGVSRIVEN